MCDKLPYCNPRIDKCLITKIEEINKSKELKTLASCCGHGIYNPTIVVKDKNGLIFEMFSMKPLIPQKRNRYYRTDSNGNYFIPEIIEKYTGNYDRRSEEKIYLSDRFKSGNSLIKLNKLQIKTKFKIQSDIRKRKLNLQPYPCLCGIKRKDILLSTSDKFGFWVKTVICLNCGLVRINPRFTPESLYIFYKKKYYYDLYLGINIKNEKIFRSQILRGLDILKFIQKYTNFKTGKVLEIGSSTGGSIMAFKMAGFEVKGIELSDDAVSFGKQKKLDIENIKFEENRAILYPKRDLIFLSHVLEHIHNVKEYLDIIHDCLKTDGLLYIEVPGIFNISQKLFNDFLLYLQNAHLYCFTLKSLVNILNRHGFELIYGNEFIKAIFKKKSRKPKDKEIEKTDLSIQILSYLKRLDSPHMRFLGKLKFQRFRIYYITQTVLEKLHLSFFIRHLKKLLIPEDLS